MTTKAIFAGAFSALSLFFSTAALAQTDLTMWYHGAGNVEERKILAGIIEDFNSS